MPRLIRYQVSGPRRPEGTVLLRNVLQDVIGVQQVAIDWETSCIDVQIADGVPDPDVELINQQVAPEGYALVADVSRAPVIDRFHRKGPVSWEWAVLAVIMATCLFFLVGSVER